MNDIMSLRTVILLAMLVWTFPLWSAGEAKDSVYSWGAWQGIDNARKRIRDGADPANVTDPPEAGDTKQDPNVSLPDNHPAVRPSPVNGLPGDNGQPATVPPVADNNQPGNTSGGYSGVKVGHNNGNKPGHPATPPTTPEGTPPPGNGDPQGTPPPGEDTSNGNGPGRPGHQFGRIGLHVNRPVSQIRHHRFVPPQVKRGWLRTRPGRGNRPGTTPGRRR